MGILGNENYFWQPSDAQGLLVQQIKLLLSLHAELLHCFMSVRPLAYTLAVNTCFEGNRLTAYELFEVPLLQTWAHDMLWCAPLVISTNHIIFVYIPIMLSGDSSTQC